MFVFQATGPYQQQQMMVQQQAVYRPVEPRLTYIDFLPDGPGYKYPYVLYHTYIQVWLSVSYHHLQSDINWEATMTQHTKSLAIVQEILG